MGEVIQGMAKEAGFNITLRPTEFASALKDDDAGKLQAFLIGWSGRVDPDANIHQIQIVRRQPQRHPRLRRVHRRAAEQGPRGERPRPSASRSTGEAVEKLTRVRRNIIYLYHLNYIVAFPKNLKGYKAVPDGLIRIKGTSWN